MRTDASRDMRASVGGELHVGINRLTKPDRRQVRLLRFVAAGHISPTGHLRVWSSDGAQVLWNAADSSKGSDSAYVAKEARITGRLLRGKGKCWTARSVVGNLSSLPKQSGSGG
jgi:hypothetical protein